MTARPDPRPHAGIDVEAATAHLAAADHTLAKFIEQAGPYTPRSGEGDYFASLVRAIVYQQLAGRAANAIHARLIDTVGGRMTPTAVLEATESKLRSAGLSGAKTAALLDLATKSIDRTLDFDGIGALDDEDVIDVLTTVRGIGRWTAEMFLMFELQRPDVWPVDDYGVRKGFSLIHKFPDVIGPRQLSTAGEPYRPYRSVLAWYCWQAVRLLAAAGA